MEWYQNNNQDMSMDMPSMTNVYGDVELAVNDSVFPQNPNTGYDDIFDLSYQFGGYQDTKFDAADGSNGSPSHDSFSSNASLPSNPSSPGRTQVDSLGSSEDLANAAMLFENDVPRVSVSTNNDRLLQDALAAAMLEVQDMEPMMSRVEETKQAKQEQQQEAEPAVRPTRGRKAAGPKPSKATKATKAKAGKKKTGKQRADSDSGSDCGSISTVHPDGRAKTKEELREERRQKRLIKNRESAQLSRQRKKQYLESLEKKVSELDDENRNLHQEVIALQVENRHLKQQNAMFQNLLAPHGQGMTDLVNQSNANMDMDVDQLKSEAAKAFNRKPVQLSKPGKNGRRSYVNNQMHKAGMVLVVLFSVGMLMSPTGKQVGTIVNQEFEEYRHEPIPKVSVDSSSSSSRGGMRRNLLSVDEQQHSDEQEEARPRASPAPMESTELGRGKRLRRGVEDVMRMLKSENQAEVKSAIQEQQQMVQEQPAAKRMRTNDGRRKPVMIIHEAEEEESEPHTIEGGCGTNVQGFEDQPRTYVFCGDAFHINPSSMEKATMEVNQVREELNVQQGHGVVDSESARRSVTDGQGEQEHKNGGVRDQTSRHEMFVTEGKAGVFVSEQQQKREQAKEQMLREVMRSLLGPEAGDVAADNITRRFEQQAAMESEGQTRPGDLSNPAVLDNNFEGQGGLSLSSGGVDGKSPLLSIMLPYKAFNSKANNGDLVQLTCEVRDAQMIPGVNQTDTGVNLASVA
eukprot:TRINITY_DN903_c0_g1_i1.p1 TRINITY_DN903_c0_g1~~TRINITY_DN903_c0_g1_i1.p1  ORF type:complete len:742 (-),score=337.13 TRINITY_DN903_c0_g1_i1:85-2310(-)